MSNNIQISASIRRNMLSLQNTATASTTTSRLSTGKKANTMIDEPVNYFADLSHNSRTRGLGLSKEGLQKINELTSMLANASGETQEQKAAQTLVTDSSLEAINKLSQTAQGSSQKLLDGGINFNFGTFKGINTLV